MRDNTKHFSIARGFHFRINTKDQSITLNGIIINFPRGVLRYAYIFLSNGATSINTIGALYATAYTHRYIMQWIFHRIFSLLLTVINCFTQLSYHFCCYLTCTRYITPPIFLLIYGFSFNNKEKIFFLSKKTLSNIFSCCFFRNCNNNFIKIRLKFD